MSLCQKKPIETRRSWQHLEWEAKAHDPSERGEDPSDRNVVLSLLTHHSTVGSIGEEHERPYVPVAIRHTTDLFDIDFSDFHRHAGGNRSDPTDQSKCHINVTDYACRFVGKALIDHE